MGTHATTKVLAGSAVLVNMYRHYDGYPSGHGTELAKFLRDTRLVNGISTDEQNISNGIDDLAAQIVAHFKTGPGGFYLQPHDHDEIYDYVVYEDEQGIRMKVKEGKKMIFDGTPDEFLNSGWELE